MLWEKMAETVTTLRDNIATFESGSPAVVVVTLELSAEIMPGFAAVLAADKKWQDTCPLITLWSSAQSCYVPCQSIRTDHAHLVYI